LRRQSACGDIPEGGRIPPTGRPQLHIETKISPLETASISTGLHPWPAYFERSQTEPRLPDMRKVL
jgi:hypothetical protein